jgi:nitroreductase
MSVTALPFQRPVADAQSQAELLRLRYGDPTLARPEHWNEVLATLLSHRSVRSYLRDPVSDATLATIVAAAQSAPSSSNLQVWSVIAVRDAARRARLAELVGGQGHVRDCPLFLVWLADLARLKAIGAAHDQALGGLDYLELFMVAVIDAALAAQNAVAALESLGLGCVYIGAVRNRPEDVAAELGLPPHVMPVFGLCVGWPDPAQPADIKPRLPQAAVLHHEQYDATAAPAAIATYDARLRVFQQEQGMRVQDWSQQMIARVRDAAALHGRDRMREALANLGFLLR